MLTKLAETNFNFTTDDSQSYWDLFENKLITIVDEIVPLTPFILNQTLSSAKPPKNIKHKLNLRKRLLKTLNNSPSNSLRDRIKNLNIEIKNHFVSQKRNNIQRSIIPGNSKTLWKAVNIAKNINPNPIPEVIFLDNVKISQNDAPEAFASHFESKINKIVEECRISNSVYNGRNKINVPDLNFMSEENILKVVKTLKVKNSEGHDRIPQRILIDGIDILRKPLAVLFSLIYETRQIPQQWLISKTIPIHKKGNTANIENYRPISNLCSASKFFEKLILLRLHQIEETEKIDLTGKSQHGFKRKHSTATASLVVQSLIASALDEDKFALMASLDLSSGFDVVNVELLLKRLTVIGLPNDMLTLISNWLKTRYFYVSVDGNNSYVRLSNIGTVQGSILGPILYAIFVSPLFDLAKMTLFADDNYVIRWGKCLEELIVDMEASIELITKWLRQSGLKVNEMKTEICLFHRKDHLPVKIKINTIQVTTKKSMNVLGLTFDSKLQWHIQVQNSINKRKSALNALHLIRKYFTKTQLLQLITSNYYPILYYNAEIWLLPCLSPPLKQKFCQHLPHHLK